MKALSVEEKPILRILFPYGPQLWDSHLDQWGKHLAKLV